MLLHGRPGTLPQVDAIAAFHRQFQSVAQCSDEQPLMPNAAVLRSPNHAAVLSGLHVLVKRGFSSTLAEALLSPLSGLQLQSSPGINTWLDGKIEAIHCNASYMPLTWVLQPPESQDMRCS